MKKTGLVFRPAVVFTPTSEAKGLITQKAKPGKKQNEKMEQAPGPANSCMAWVANPYFQILLSALCLTASELLLKRGASETGELSSAWSWTGINGLSSISVWWGILLMVLSFLSWLYALKHLPLSRAYPLSNVVHVMVPLSAWFFLDEAINNLRWCGIALVVLGLFLVAKPFSRIEEQL